MGEPERRRRRLRAPHASPDLPARSDPAPEDSAPADEAVVTAPPPDDTAGAPIDAGPIQAGPIATVPIETAPIATTPIEDPPGEEPSAQEVPRKPRSGFAGRPRPAPGDEREVERGLRGLVGSGSSQVSVGAALRARDAARPTDAQLAEAERDLTIVRRNWTPREDLPRNR
jgi:hypothetical protein